MLVASPLLLYLRDHTLQPGKFRANALFIEYNQFFNIRLELVPNGGVAILPVASLVLQTRLENAHARSQDLHPILWLQKAEEDETHMEFHIIASDGLGKVAQHLAQLGQPVVR